MTEDQNIKATSFNFRLSPEEEEAMADIENTDPYKSLGASRRAIVRYAVILMAQGLRDEQKLPATQDDIKKVLTAVQAVGLMIKTAPKVAEPKPSRVNARQTDEEKDAAGTETCSLLGGTVIGRSCTYKKYEVMASGRPASYEVTEPLISLSEATVAAQYDPSREAYERATVDWKDEQP